PCASTPPSLLINGNSSSGKTAVVKAVLNTVLATKSPSRYAFLDCVECHTPRLLFEHAIYQFRNPPPLPTISSTTTIPTPTATSSTTSPPTRADSTTESRLEVVREQSLPSNDGNNTSRNSSKRRTGAAGELTSDLTKRQRRSTTNKEQLNWEKCENINEFVEWCRKICDQPDDVDNDHDADADSDDDMNKGKTERSQAHAPQEPKPSGRKKSDTRYLVLDRAERLRDTAPTLIPVLMRLQELTGRNMCVILISTIVWEKFRSKTGGYEPIVLNFPQYTKQETLAILKLDMATGQDPELYMRFVDLVYDVFQRNCKDLNEIRHLVSLLFPLYVKPVKEGKIQAHEVLKLHRHIQAYFVEAMDKLYLREISSTEWSDRTLLSASKSDGGAPGSERAMMTAVQVQNILDLPYYTKFILIASFLASYNPPKLDMRYFAKVSNQGSKMTKRAKNAAAKKHGHEQMGSKLRQQLLGPKTFQLERMLAIFYSILEEEVEENVNVHTQIASLVSLRLLQRITPMDKLDSIKCKCNVSYDTIKALAKSTKFDIDKYLYDFS
ncbi:Origin recognition complex subunit 5, partial [Podila epigama]